MRTCNIRYSQVMDGGNGILPLRTKQEFFDEGKQEAYNLAKYYNVKEDKVLEFGCGNGRILNYIKAKEVHGADINKYYLKQITDTNITTHLYNGSSILKPLYFDFIYSQRVFQHIEYDLITNILKNLYASLNFQGSMRIQFPQNPSPYFIKTNSNFSNNIRLFTIFDIEELFEEAELPFKVEEGNLIGYGEGGKIKPKRNVEFFITVTK